MTAKAPGHKVVLVAACVLVDGEGRVLLARRPAGKALAGLWEFPGGKVEAGEAPEAALIRELKEELGIGVDRRGLRPLTFVSYAYPEFHLVMPVYVCRQWQGRIIAHEGQEIAWVRPDALSAFDMPPADEPLKRTLPDLLRLAQEYQQR